MSCCDLNEQNADAASNAWKLEQSTDEEERHVLASLFPSIERWQFWKSHLDLSSGSRPLKLLLW